MKKSVTRPDLIFPRIGAPAHAASAWRMAFTAEQKRERRAEASQQQREDDAARKRKKRASSPQREHAVRKKRREAIFAAAERGDKLAHAMLDAGARRAREYRERIMESAMDAKCGGVCADATISLKDAIARHPAVMVLRRQADRKHAARLPGVEARRAERMSAHAQRNASVAAAKQHYLSCRQEVSRIRKQWYKSRKQMARFSGGPVCTATTCKHKMCYNMMRHAEAKAEEHQRAVREQDAILRSKDALKALKAARRKPLRGDISDT